MSSKIVNSAVRHRIQFAPDPTNTSFPTVPEFVGNRLVREILEFPENVRYVSFHDIAEVDATEPGQLSGVVDQIVLHTEPFNVTTFYVAHTRDDANRLCRNGHDLKVAVHPALEGKVWVFACDPRSYREQEP